MKKSTLWNSYWKIKDSIDQMKMLLDYENYQTDVFESLNTGMINLKNDIKEVIRRAETGVSGPDQEVG